MEELINTQSDVVGRLAFKYMEMCKVDSSSDSESESSPRWSDVSSKGCESSTSEAPEKLFRQNYQQGLDPYDGSSEDSGSSAPGSRKRRPGGFRVKGTGRRLTFDPGCGLGEVRRGADVQMRSSSDSEPDSALPDWSPCIRPDLSDSGFHTRSPLSLGLQSASPDSPALTAFSKRKFFPPSDEGMQRKRQCVSDMEL